ncbi:hypothetical protein EV426DRAFT_578630 [Tirmania nivea]|nr:hypothetical protein EV426DRAFT_578630 [Tirmania nivea]
MAPIGQINYLTDKSVSQAVNILAQDIAKKVRSGAVIRDKAVKAIRKGHAAKYPDDPSPPTLGQLLLPLPTAPQDTSTVMLDTSTRNSQPKRIRTPETIKGLQRKNEDEGEEADAEESGKTLRGPKRIVGAGKGYGISKTGIEEGVVNIEEDEEDEEEEVPKNIKTKSGKVKVGGGKGSVRPPGTRTSKKVVDDKEEEEAPTYTYTKTKSGTGSVGAGKGIVRPKGIRTSKKVMNVEDDDEEEEEAPTYTYTKTKSGTGSVGVRTGNTTRTSKKVVNFEVDDEEEEEEEEEEDEVPAYIKTKSRKGYVGGAKGIVGGSGSGKSKGMVKMSGVQITRVQQEKEDEEEEEEAAEEEGQEEAEVEEDTSSACAWNIIVSVGTFTRKSMTKPEAKRKGKEISRKRGASCDLRDDTIKRQTVNTKKSSSRQLKSNGKGQASISSPVSSAFQATINFPEYWDRNYLSSNESSGSAGGRHRGTGSQGNSSSTIVQTQGSSQLSCEWGSSDINQARSSLPLSIELDVHDIDNRVNRPKKRLTGAKANYGEIGVSHSLRVWKEAEIECRVDEERTSKIDAYLRSIQSRTRSHLVYEAKRHIAKLYEFDQNCSSEYIRKRVSWLLDKDRLTCQYEKWASRGIQRWGLFQLYEFLYLAVAFNRMLKQWEGLPTTAGAKSVEVLRWEEAESYSIDNDELDEYAKELVEDLKRAEQIHLIPYGYFEEGSPTVPDTEGEVDDMPTMHAKNAVHSPVSKRYDFSREDVEDAERDSGDTDSTGSVAVEDEDEDEGMSPRIILGRMPIWRTRRTMTMSRKTGIQRMGCRIRMVEGWKE